MVLVLGWLLFLCLADFLHRREWVLARPKLVQHLRLAPLALLLSMMTGVGVYHWGMVQISKNEIRTYIFGQQPPLMEPQFNHLHVIARGTCGRGVFEQIFALYGETAAAGLNDPNPAVRLRSLQAIMVVGGWSLEENPKYQQALAKAKQDPDLQIQFFLKQNNLLGEKQTTPPIKK